MMRTSAIINLIDRVGHFLFTKLLLNKMIETAKSTGIQGRIMNVTSNIHSRFSGDVFECFGQISQSNR